MPDSSGFSLLQRFLLNVKLQRLKRHQKERKAKFNYTQSSGFL